MEEEIKYIPYGTDAIDYNQFLQKSANEVQDYVNSQSWSSKRKQSFLNAYQDLISRGIIGATNEGGIWRVNHGGDAIDLDSMSKRDREMYGEAAYFIRRQMEQAPTKSQREREKQEALDKLPSYDNEHFVSGFNTSLSKNYYGGREIDVQKDWNTLDERDSRGIRGTKNRAARLADALEKYSNELEEGKYNFKNSLFKDLSDVKNKIAITVADLRDDNSDNDVDALNRIGLKYDNYFYNGADDTYTNGEYQGTYNDYYSNYLPELEKQKAKQQQAQLKTEQEKKAQEVAAVQAQQYKRLRFLGTNFNGKSLNDLSKYPDPLTQLSSYGTLQGLNNDQISELVGAFKNAASKGMLQNLSKEEQLKFSGFSNLSKPGRLKKIEGLSGFYWDTIGNRVIQPIEGEVSTNKFNDLVKNSNPLAKPLTQQWTDADTADVISIIGDVVSLGGLWANVGGSITSIGADIYADIARGKNIWDITKGVGQNLVWAGVGLIPTGKAPKLVAKSLKFVPRLLAAAAATGVAIDPEVWKSANKLTSLEDIKTFNSQDLENLKYLMHAATGTVNMKKNISRGNKYKQEINKQEIKTKDNSTVKLTNKQVKEVNKAGRKGGQKAAEEKFKKVSGGKEVAEGTFKFSNISKLNPARYSNKIHNATSSDKQLKGKQVVDNEAIQTLLEQDKQRSWYNWNKGYTKWDLFPFKKVKTPETSSTNVIENTTPKVNPWTNKAVQDQIMVENSLNPTKNTLSRQHRVIKNDESYTGTIFGNDTFTVKFKDNTISIQGGGQNISKKVSSDTEAKKIFTNFVNNLNKKISKQLGNVKRTYSVQEIESIKALKRKGFMYKQGGTLDTTISNFFKK